MPTWLDQYEFDTTSNLYCDQWPTGWLKKTPQVSYSGLVQLKMNNKAKKYSGMYKTGADFAFVKMSSVGPSAKIPTALKLSIKVLRDGVKSGNFHGAYDEVTGSKTLNWFDGPITNSFRTKLGKVSSFQKKVRSYMKSIYNMDVFFLTRGLMMNIVGISDLAKYEQNGSRANDEEFKSPFSLIFQPNPELRNDEME